MNSTCTVRLPADTGDLVQRPRDVQDVGDHLDSDHRRGVRVRPAGDLVHVVADAGDLPRTLALDLGRRRGPGGRPRHGLPQQAGGRHAGRGPLACQAACSSGVGGDHDGGATVSHGAPPRGAPGAQSANGRGSKGCAAAPRQPQCSTLSKLAPAIQMTGAKCSCAPFPSFVVSCAPVVVVSPDAAALVRQLDVRAAIRTGASERASSSKGQVGTSVHGAPLAWREGSSERARPCRRLGRRRPRAPGRRRRAERRAGSGGRAQRRLLEGGSSRAATPSVASSEDTRVRVPSARVHLSVGRIVASRQELRLGERRCKSTQVGVLCGEFAGGRRGDERHRL